MAVYGRSDAVMLYNFIQQHPENWTSWDYLLHGSIWLDADQHNPFIQIRYEISKALRDAGPGKIVKRWIGSGGNTQCASILFALTFL